MKIVVLAGGLSTERQVALTSGTGVCRALRERGHQAILVDMFLGLESYEGRLEDIFDAPDGLCGDNRVTEEAPDLEAVRRSRKDQGPSLLGKDVLAVCAMADIVFLALHGSCGEDGRIQATLDLLRVPYTGSGYLGSGMAMDKSVTKRFLESEGIRTAPWRDVHYTASDIPRLVEHFLRVLPLATGRDLRVDPAIYGCLKSYSWPGNVRELRNVIERAIILADNGLISGKGLPPEIACSSEACRAVFRASASDDELARQACACAFSPGTESAPLPSAEETQTCPPPPAADALHVPAELLRDDGSDRLDLAEKRHILHVLEKCGGNRSLAARRLGIGRRTLYRRLEEWGMA